MRERCLMRNVSRSKTKEDWWDELTAACLSILSHVQCAVIVCLPRRRSSECGHHQILTVFLSNATSQIFLIIYTLHLTSVFMGFFFPTAVLAHPYTSRSRNLKTGPGVEEGSRGEWRRERHMLRHPLHERAIAQLTSADLHHLWVCWHHRLGKMIRCPYQVDNHIKGNLAQSTSYDIQNCQQPGGRGAQTGLAVQSAQR